LRILLAVLIHAHLAQLWRIAHAVPDEIVPAMAHPQVVVEPGDGVPDNLLPLGQEEWLRSPKIS
jgi:hypothetical protein